MGTNNTNFGFHYSVYLPPINKYGKFPRISYTEIADKIAVSSGSTLFATHPAILDTTLGNILYLFKF